MDTDKIEIGKRLPVYYFPFQDIITGEKLANADGGELYVTPDDMYYTVESISEDKKTITLRFHGDYTKPGRIINTFNNPLEDIATNMSTRLPIKFDNEKYNDNARWELITDDDGNVVLDENGKPQKKLTTDNSIVKVAKADGSELEEFVFKAESQYDSYGIEEVRQAGHGQTTSQVVHPEYDARATGVPIETSNPEQIDKGTVIVQYVDENGNVLKEEVQDVTDAEVDTEYDTVTDNRPQEITVGDKTYELVPAGDYNVGSVSDQGNLTTSKLRNVYGSTDAEGTEPTGTVTQGTKYVTYVYKEKPPVVKEGTVTVNYEDEEGNVIKDPVEDTPSSPVDTPYNTTDNRPEEIKTDDGKTYERIPDKTKGTEEGNVVEGNTDVTYVYKEVKGDVIVHYIDTEGNTIAKDETDTPLSSTGTAYDTSDDHMPETITKDGVTYELVPALTKGNEQGKVVKGTTEVTYVYKKVEPPVEAPTGDVIVHYVDEEGNKIAKDKVDTQGSKVDTPYDTTDNRPEKITTDDGKTYERIPEKTEGNEEGKVVEGTTEVTYVYKEVKGDVIVHYIDTEGNVIADDAVDTPETSTGTDYDTSDDHKPQTITKDGVTYELVPVLTKGNEQGKVVEGTTEVTYVYKKVEAPSTPEDPGMPPEETPNKYIPYIPEDPENPKYDENVPPVDPNTGDPIDPVDYDETPEYPSDNPPLPDIDGHIPVDPEDPTTPLKPKDPNDPTKGYEPPKPVDPKEDTPVPYVPAGMVTVHYVDENDNVIKDPTVDTPKSPVGTAYNTNENGTEIPEKITKDGKEYELVQVKDGDVEQGKVVKGNTDVTYIYKLKKQPEDPGMPPEETPNKYIPYIPEDPNDPKYDENVPPVDPNTGEPLEPIDYDDTPEDPSDNPPLPDIYGHIPVDPEDPTTPLKPKDPNDPTKGYEPPKPVDPKEDTPVPYVPAGMVTVHYVDEDGNVIKDSTVDTPKSPVGTEYNTNENGEEIPKEITKDGKVYEYVKVKDGDKETGKVVKGNTNVTYIYKLKKQPEDPGMPPEETPNKYIPYIPEDPENPKYDENVPPVDPNTGKPIDPVDYDETPEDPSDNPPLPDIDGHIPVDPEDPTKPLKPKDPNDPTKGYEPPKPVDPKKDTPVPYVPAGMVTVHYVDEDGNVIKYPTVDTPKSPVGTEYNTNENGTEIPKEIIGKDGKVYVLVKVKDGDKETGKVVKGNTDVTYIYKLKEQPGKPGQPGVPGKPGKPGTPEDPSTPPVDPKDEDPNVPPMDPKDKDPNVPPMDPGMPGQPSPDQPNNMEKPSKGMTDKDGKGMKPSDKMTEKELPETGNTNNPFVTTFGFLTLLAGMKLTKRNRREED